MKMQLPKFRIVSACVHNAIKTISRSSFKFLAIIALMLFGKGQLNAQTVLNETFSNLTTVDYTASITTANFDVAGWTQSGNKITVAEAGSVTIGKSGTSGSDLTTPVMDLSGTDIVILSFKLKYYGPNSITASTSVKTIVNLDGSPVFVTSKGVVTSPAGLPNYDNSSWTTYSIILTGGTSTSTLTFKGTSSGYAYMIDDVVVTKAAMPTVATTTPPATINFTSATLGGNITATGLPITESGIVWSTSNNNPTTADSKIPTSPLVTSGAFSVNLSGLTAGGTYYFNTYVVTPAGTAYGTASSFVTPIPDYKLTSAPAALEFGGVAINSSTVLQYSVSGKDLTPASDNITVTAPAGFTISTSANGPFSSSLTLPYTGGILSATTIYVKYAPTVAFSFESGVITLSGGGATSDYIINEKVSAYGKLTDPAVTSNAGNDFWLGFGYHTAMDQTDGDRANLSIYVSSPDKDATVVVEMPGLNGGFTPIEVFVPKGTVQEVSGFPLGDGTKFNTSNQADARLYFTGISGRAIHVYSKDGTPVSVWMYSYSTDNSAAGSMIFPTNTWNTSYSVQAYGNSTNSGNPNSFFYVIGQEDGTEFDFTPSVNILDSAAGNLLTKSPTGGIKYFAGQTYHITINRGEVFNAMSGYQGSAGLDLTGTTVKSTNCKKIAVFGGNGRTIVDVNIPSLSGQSGSDNLVQQMFPKVAWGTKYYTTPTKHMEYNLFRISVDDPTTQVWVNDPLHNPANVLTGLNNGYFEYQTNQPSIIESDKPISVTQFIASQMYATGKSSFGAPSDYGMNGLGDPEMIILSPAQQAINKATVYLPSFKNGHTPAGAYINVVIPKTGVSSFKLDPETNIAQMVDTGSSSYTGIPLDPAPALIAIADAFKPYDSDANYYYAKFKVEFPAQHTLVSNVPFNAIAYGTNDGESYGFNAGTQVNDLTAPLILNNPYGDSLNTLNSSKPLTTCVGTDVILSATLPFANVAGHPITFNYNNNSNITPNADDVIANPVLSNTFVFNGQTFYVYKLTQKHSFSATGAYSINVTYFDPTPTVGCGNEGGANKTISYSINVVNGVTAAFGIDYNSCVNETVKLTDASVSSNSTDSITAWNWTYDNGSKPLPGGQDIVKNPTFTNPVDNAAKNVKLLAINSIGCFGTLQQNLPTPTIPTITFNNEFAPVCSNAAVVTLNQATPAGGSYSGPGVTNNAGVYTFNPAAQGVSTTAPNTITYTYANGAGCSNTGTNTIVVNPLPVVSAGNDLTVVQNIPITITGTSNVDGTYTWSPATGLNSTNGLVTEAQINEIGNYIYRLTVSANNCSAFDEMTLTVKSALPCLDPMKGFTPNGDGFNEKWLVYNDEGCFTKVQVDVYNRYGGLVYHSDKYTNNWTGEFRGKAIPDATYYYVIKATDGTGHVQIKTGNVTIIR